jgi:hypothetical protein
LRSSALSTRITPEGAAADGTAVSTGAASSSSLPLEALASLAEARASSRSPSWESDSSPEAPSLLRASLLRAASLLLRLPLRRDRRRRRPPPAAACWSLLVPAAFVEASLPPGTSPLSGEEDLSGWAPNSAGGAAAAKAAALAAARRLTAASTGCPPPPSLSELLLLLLLLVPLCIRHAAHEAKTMHDATLGAAASWHC